MKVRVAGMAWIPKTDLGLEGIGYFKRKLHIVPRKMYNYDNTVPTPIDCWAETANEFGVPRDYFFATAEKKHQIQWDMTDGSRTSYESLILHDGMYAEQGLAVNGLCEWLNGWSCHEDDPMQAGLHLGAILKADPGFGKTNTALSVIHRLGRTAVIIVHKERLLVQWMNRIKKFLPGARVGIVQEDKCQFEDKDIVIAMVQSLALEGQEGKRRYPEEFYNWPGVLIVDETHRIGAPTWSPVPELFSAKYRLGLSATPRRKDGADDVFWWHIGKIRYSAKTEMPKLPVRLIESGARGPDMMRKEDTPLPIVINVLTRLSWRNKRIVGEIVKALKSPNGRKLMVLSERLEHLQELDKLLSEACESEGLKGITTGFYVGEWFTGEQYPRLVKGHWEMDENGRESAISTIFQSFRRRKTLKAEKDADANRLILWNDEWLDLDSLYDVSAGMDEAVKKEIFEAADKCLFEIAKEHKILQKKKEKMRSRTEEELIEAERARVIWVTYQMCGEGIDQPAVDTLGFASPISDVEQAYGRGRRFCVPVKNGGDSTPEMCQHYCAWRADSCTGKPQSIVFDVVDKNVVLSKKRLRYRMEFYHSVGAKIAGNAS